MGSLPNLHAIGSERPPASRLQPWDDCMLELSGCPSPRACRLHRASLSSSGASSVRRLIASVRAAPPVLAPALPRRRLLRNHAALCLGQVSWSGGPLPLLALSPWWPGAGPLRGSLLPAALFCAAALSAAAAPALLRRLGAARLLLAAHALSACFLAAHLLPVPAALVPAYLLQGVAVGAVGVSRAAQLWALSARLPGCDVTGAGAGAAALLAALSAAQDAGLALGSALAAALLAWAASAAPPPASAVCGAAACPPAPDAAATAAPAAPPAAAPAEQLEVGCRAGPLLAAALLGLAVAGAALAAACLDRLPPPPPGRPRPPPAAPAAPAGRVARALAAPPLALFVGLGQAFMLADFSRWYVACVLSPASVSLSFAALAALRCVAGLTLHLVLPHICRLLAVGVGAAFHSCLLLVLALWQPSSDDSALFFVIAAAWGVCDAIWETLALTSALASQLDWWPRRLAWWEASRCLGLSLAFALQPLLCVRVKLYALAAALLLAVPPYAWLEVRHGADVAGL